MSDTEPTDAKAQSGTEPETSTKRRKLYVHIGMHKTGTTAIQRFSARNRESLLNSGMLYPKLPLETELGFVHHFLVAVACCADEKTRNYLVGSFDPHSLALINNYTSEQLISIVLSQIDETQKDVVMTSEAFYLLDDVSVKNFGDIFKKFEIIPIFYHRNFSDWICSFYDTYIFYAKGTLDLMAASFNPFSIESYIDRWSAIATNKKVRLVSYDLLRQDKVSLVEDFYHRIGITLPNTMVGSDAAENTSNRPDIQIIARELRKSGASENQINETARTMGLIKPAYRQRLLGPADTAKFDDLYQTTMRSLLSSDKVEGLIEGDIITPDRNYELEKPILNLFDAVKSLVDSTVMMQHQTDKPLRQSLWQTVRSKLGGVNIK
jgi:hypothetical protein